jgi:hypothetical protein
VSIPDNGKGTYRTRYVFESLLAQISELDCDLTGDVIVGRRRDTDAAGFSNALKPRRNIDAVTENVITLDQDVTKVDPDPVQHTPVIRDALVPLGHHRLHRYRALDRIDYGRKLKQQAVSRGLHEATAVFCHEGVGDLAVFAECAGGAYFVEAHETRVASNVSRHYCC